MCGTEGVFSVELRDFWCRTEGCVEVRGFWFGFWGLKRSGPFVWNRCVELRGCGTEGGPFAPHARL